jgi:hypothetical protein
VSRYFEDAGFANRRFTNTRLLASAAAALVKAVNYGFDAVQAEIDAGSGGGGGGLLVFDYSANALWIVNHNLGRDVTVEVRSAGGAQIRAEVLQYSLNQVRVYFEVPVPGKVLIR